MTVDSLKLTQTVFNDIVAHAREGSPEEVCGILRGRGDRAFQIVRGLNIAPNRIQDYEVDSQTLLRQIDFEEQGDAMVAIYHSHPVSPAFPSASDAWSAFYPDAAYIICSLEVVGEAKVRAFRMVSFDVSIDVTQVGAALDFVETRPGRYGYFQPIDTALPAALNDVCDHIAMPFYIVYETPHEIGKTSLVRVVSISQVEIVMVPG